MVIRHVPQRVASVVLCLKFLLDSALQHPLRGESGLIQITVLMEIGVEFLKLLRVFNEFLLDGQPVIREKRVE